MRYYAKTVGTLFLLLTVMMAAGCAGVNKTISPNEKYPEKPITVIVPFSAGGLTDIIARGLEKTAAKQLEQPLVIVNKPGGGGTIAWNELVKVKPDGYTIGIMTIGGILQPIFGQSKYHYSSALEPIAQIADPPIVMSVSANSNFKTLDELVAYAREHPGKLKIGNTGLGSLLQVVGEMFSQSAGIKIEQVPFQGSSEEIAALLGGHVDIIFSGTSELREHVKGNKIRVLAVAGKQRPNDPDFYEVPTFTEKGYTVVINNFQCLVIPKELPPMIKDKLVVSFKNIIADAEFKKNMKQLGIEVQYLGPDECSQAWANTSEKLAKVVKETGIDQRVAAQRK